MISVGCFNLQDLDNYDLCHVILYSGFAGYAYVGLRYINALDGNVISPYTYTRFGTAPESSSGPGNHDCHHTNIKGSVTAGGLYEHRNGKDYYPSLYTRSTPDGVASPGFVYWKYSDDDYITLPSWQSWSDGREPYYNWFPDYACLYPLDTMVHWNNWRGQHAFDVKFSGDTSYYSWEVNWDPNFTERPASSASGPLVWNAERRVFLPSAPVADGACCAYALPVRKSSARYFFSGLDARSAYFTARAVLEKIPTLPYEGEGPVRKALENFNALNMNNVENSGGLTIKDLIPLEAIRDFKKHPVKASSALYLWYKYSFAPNVSDLSQIWQRAGRVLDQVDRKQKSYGTVISSGLFESHPYSTTYNACIEGSLNGRTELQKVAQRFSSVGFGLNAQNVWDLIPFSFIIDWFLPISDILGETDYEFSVMLNKWNISSVEQSTRTQCDIASASLFPNTTGTVSLVQYHREYSSVLPMNQFEFGSKHPTKHILDGAALIISNW